MKKLCFLLLLLPFVCLSQTTYYNPSQKLDITITVKEPFKRVNYAEIGQNFNNAMQTELAKRETLKRYYENIYYETKNSIYENSIFTNDYNIDKLINNLQSSAIRKIDVLYTLLTQGQKQPNLYESELKKVYYEYNNGNRQLAYISKYKYQKTNAISSPNDLSEFNLIFEKVINSISSFEFDYQGNINFELNKILYDGNNSINNILTFVSAVCDKQINLDELKQNYDNKLKDDLIKERKEKKELAQSFFDFYANRLATLNSLDDKKRVKYLMNELKYVKKNYNHSFCQEYVSKSDKFISENVIFNIIDKKIILNRDEVDESKIIYVENFYDWSSDRKLLSILSYYLKNESGIKITRAQ